MLCNSGCAVSKEFSHHLQAYSSVKASSGISVSCDVRKDRFINPT